MRRRSTASQPAKAPRRKAEVPKRRSAPAARGSASDGGQETMVARLTRELNEALDRQAATAEILRLISSSPAGVQPVFDAIVRNFVLLCGTVFGTIYTFDGELVHFAGSYGFSPEQLEATRTKYPVRVDDRSVLSSRAILAKAPLHIESGAFEVEKIGDRSPLPATMGRRRHRRRFVVKASNGRPTVFIFLLREGVARGSLVGRSKTQPDRTLKSAILPGA